ncbi:MAG: alpha/beta hydrolase-fold protein [Sumerlaeia bacterium]
MSSNVGLGEVLDLSVERETTFGQSVFVSAPHPLFGDGDVTRAVKLSPHAYPMWTLQADLPKGVTLPLTYYLRNDSPDQLPSAANATAFATRTINAPEASLSPQKITVYADAAASVAEVRITSTENGFAPLIIPLTKSVADGHVLFTGEVEPVHRLQGRSMQIFVDGTSVLSAPQSIRCHSADLYFKEGQAFLYDPVSTASAPQRLTFNFTPVGFQPRQIKVLLPRGYAENTTKHYPVVYLQDGQNVFSPGGAFGSWDADITASAMIARGELPEVILVAIDNTSDRFAEYIPEYATLFGVEGRGDEFVTALRDGLMPMINSTYRTLPEAEFTLHVGSSLGGLLGYHIARNHEETWGAVIAMSCSFQVELNQNLAFAQLPPSEWSRFYFDSGTAGTSNDGYANTVAVRDAMIEAGHVYGDAFYFTVGLGQQHNEAAWRSRFAESMRWWAGPLLEELGKASGEERWVVY